MPSRELKDYYATIKHPLSIKGALKLVKGIKGRDKPTNTTFLKTWEAFENEISWIWKNARLYNEDGSDISQLAGRLEEYFKLRVAKAKEVFNLIHLKILLCCLHRIMKISILGATGQNGSSIVNGLLASADDFVSLPAIIDVGFG